MLKTVSPLVSPELPKVLTEMERGDEIIFSDVHFPARSMGPQAVHADGLLVSDLLQAIIPLFRLDSYAPPLVMMAAVEGGTLDPGVERRYRNVLSLQAPRPGIIRIDHFVFCERAQKAFAIVVTGGRAKYGNILLKRGAAPQPHTDTPMWHGRLSNDGVRNMKTARQQAIVGLLLNHTSLTTEALSEQLEISRETIRRDLNELQTQGKILRSHGRTKYIHRQNQDSGDPFHIKLKSYYVHKVDIARKALAWTEEGMVIALDANSACWCLARQLPDINTQVFTNGHPICHELGKHERIQLISSGGTLEHRYGCYVDSSLISQLKSLEIDLFISSREGIDSSDALWDSDTIDADYKSMPLKRATQSLLLIDRSKFNRSGEVRIGHLDEVVHIIFDERQLQLLQ